MRQLSHLYWFYGLKDGGRTPGPEFDGGKPNGGLALPGFAIGGRGCIDGPGGGMIGAIPGWRL